MKIPIWLASILCSAVLTSQGWLVLAVVELKADMAAVKATLSVQHQTTNIATK